MEKDIEKEEEIEEPGAPELPNSTEAPDISIRDVEEESRDQE